MTFLGVYSNDSQKGTSRSDRVARLCHIAMNSGLPPIYGGVEITPWPSQPLAIQAASAQDHKRGQDARRGHVAM